MLVPALMPVTIPVPALTVALAVLLLLHAPPPGLHERVVVLPTHAAAVPLMADGPVVTVATIVLTQPAAEV
jgi:hypothetical protein